MSISRRNVLKSIARGIPASQIAPSAMDLSETNSERILLTRKGTFQPTRVSLRSYKIPEWFHSAKIKESIA